ncbi:hypothetical protein [Massilia sp. PWRC2]|uniref:hypothetical protein n=1 Tax=Massilia sp. PWRC2 TaxID=2804626 RepID=UPI003CE67043
MRTLYDVLGLSRSASAAQIEAAYHGALAAMDGAAGSDDLIRAKAIGEAHSVLASPSRRDAYDARLRQKEAAPLTVVVETPARRWPVLLALAALLIGGMLYYQVQAQRAATERMALEATRASAAAAAAARLAEAEEARLAGQVLAERARADAQRAQEIASARREPGRSVTISYDPDGGLSPERRRELAAARVKAEQQQDEVLARRRNLEQTLAMQRALAIPIVKH